MRRKSASQASGFSCCSETYCFSNGKLEMMYHQLFYLFLQAGAVPHFLYEEYHTLYHTDIKIPFNEIHTSDKIIVSTYCIKGYL